MFGQPPVQQCLKFSLDVIHVRLLQLMYNISIEFVSITFPQHVSIFEKWGYSGGGWVFEKLISRNSASLIEIGSLPRGTDPLRTWLGNIFCLLLCWNCEAAPRFWKLWYVSHGAIVKLPALPEACVVPRWEKTWGRRKCNFKLRVGRGVRNEQCSLWQWATLTAPELGRSGGTGRAWGATGTDGLSPRATWCQCLSAACGEGVEIVMAWGEICSIQRSFGREKEKPFSAVLLPPCPFLSWEVESHLYESL